MTHTLLRCAVGPLVGLLAVGCAPSNQTKQAQAPAGREVAAAVVEFFPARHSEVHGLVHVRIIDNGGVLFRGNVTGLKAGLYGFGVHERGDCSAFDGKSAGGLIAGKGAASTKPLGRLEDLLVEHDGTANLQRVEQLTLSGSDSIVGKSLVVEAWPYDPKTDPTAVPFVACGVIRAD
jgi:Cu-Zn family superoxide dismutase